MWSEHPTDLKTPNQLTESRGVNSNSSRHKENVRQVICQRRLHKLVKSHKKFKDNTFVLYNDAILKSLCSKKNTPITSLKSKAYSIFLLWTIRQPFNCSCSWTEGGNPHQENMETPPHVFLPMFSSSVAS